MGNDQKTKLPDTTRFAILVAAVTALVCIAIFLRGKGPDASASGYLPASVSVTEKAAPTNEIPATITREWCGRLGQRLEPRLASEAEAKYPGRNASANVHEYVLNLVNNCLGDVGKAMAPHWKCHWDETFDSSENCKEMEREARKAERTTAVAAASAQQAAVNACTSKCQEGWVQCGARAAVTDDQVAAERCLQALSACNLECHR